MASNPGFSVLVLLVSLAGCGQDGLQPSAGTDKANPATVGEADGRDDVAVVWTRGGRVLLRRPVAAGDPP